MTQTQKAIKEMMEAYNENLVKWLDQFGTKDGFNEWYTAQVMKGATQ